MTQAEFEECKLLEFPEGDDDESTGCRICGEEKTGLHYGVISCSDCRFFFRRMSLRKRDLVCVGYDYCDLRKREGEKNCPACRFNKCVKEGMVREDPRDWVQSIDLPGPSTSKVKYSPDSSFDTEHNTSFCECCGEESGIQACHDARIDGIREPPPVVKKTAKKFREAMEKHCDFMLEQDFGKAKKMRNLLNSSRKEIWEMITGDVARVCCSIISFANAIEEFKQLRASERFKHLQGSLFALTILALSRGFDKELDQVQIGSICYPKSSLLLTEEEMNENMDLGLTHQIFRLITEAWSYRLNADQLSLLMGLVLFEGTGAYQSHLHTAFLYYCPTVPFYMSVYKFLNRVSMLHHFFAERVQAIADEMPYAQIPRVFTEFFILGVDYATRQRYSEKFWKENAEES